MKRIGVLASGEGTNLQAVMDASERGDIPGEVSLTISDRRKAGALRRAESKRIPAFFMDPRRHTSREDYDKEIQEKLSAYGVDLVVLAGFMRVLTPVMVDAYPGRIMNVHPSLLPAFPGVNAVKKALEKGVKVTGCTVHFVDRGVDTGPIILQEAVRVLQEDREETLHQRIHAAEYRLYPRAIDLYCRDKIIISGRRCYLYEEEQ